MQRDIFLALERLLTRKAYADITIQEICGETHISRPTFYRYFNSKNGIMLWLIRQSLDVGIAKIGRRYSWFEGFCSTLTVYYRHRVCSGLHSQALDNTLLSFSANYSKNNFIATLRDTKHIEPTERLIFQIDALSYAQAHVIQKWAAEGMGEVPEIIAEYLTSIVPVDLYELLKKPVTC
jgi:AcrR family transcriptional regulator